MDIVYWFAILKTKKNIFFMLLNTFVKFVKILITLPGVIIELILNLLG